MTPESPPARPPCRTAPRVPPFYPVPTRSRRDGWTVARQAEFLGMLVETRSVIGACEAVGMSRNSAYRLRARPGAESFAAAWDAALGLARRKMTALARDFLSCHRPVHLVMFRGRYREAWYNRADGTLVRLPGGRCGDGRGDRVSPG